MATDDRIQQLTDGVQVARDAITGLLREVGSLEAQIHATASTVERLSALVERGDGRDSLVARVSFLEREREARSVLRGAAAAEDARGRWKVWAILATGAVAILNSAAMWFSR